MTAETSPNNRLNGVSRADYSCRPNCPASSAVTVFAKAIIAPPRTKIYCFRKRLYPAYPNPTDGLYSTVCYLTVLSMEHTYRLLRFGAPEDIGVTILAIPGQGMREQKPRQPRKRASSFRQ